MKYYQNRNIKSALVRYLRNVFKLYASWTNQEIEVIQVSDANSPRVEEQYPFNNENYPIVIIGGAGSDPDAWSLNSFITNSQETLYVGKEPNSYSVLEVNTPIAFGVQSPEDFSIRNIGLNLKVNNNSDYDVMLTLMSSSFGTPTTNIASGSILASKIGTEIKWAYTELSSEVVLTKNTQYFVQASLTNGRYGSYYLIEDNSPDLSITPFVRRATSGSNGWSVTSGSTPLGLIQGPIYRLLGGGMTTRFTIFIEAKDLAAVQKLSELIFVYLNVARHTNLKRENQLDFPNATRTEFEQMGDLANTGIHVVDLTKGSESVRDRGNDRIFSLSLTLTCYSSWAEVYGAPTLKEIDTTDIDNF